MNNSLHQGDLVWLDFNPVKGHEQAGLRPALVVSNNDFNHLTGLVKVCAITTNMKPYPLAIPLDSRTKTRGQILTHQERIVDPVARNVHKKEDLPRDILQKVLGYIQATY